jgi:hypothetical protein
VIVGSLVYTIMRASRSNPSARAGGDARLSIAADPSIAAWHGDVNGTDTWVTVIPRGHSIPADARLHDPWWQWGNATTDAYMFSFEQLDNVRLILSFSLQSDGLPEARIYVNQHGAKPLDFNFDAGGFQVQTNGGRPALIVRPEHGSWLIDGKTNYNLQLTDYLETPDQITDQPSPDQVPDLLIQVTGQRPGIPDWEVDRVPQDPHPDWSIPRFGAQVRMADAPPFAVSPPVMPDFPYLGIGNGTINWFEQNPNPLYFDTDRSQFTLLPFVGFQNGGTYELNSLSIPPHLDFESPYGYYNFDASSREAQLVVRAESFPTGDTFGAQPHDRQRSSFRYSWKTWDDKRWAYSLDVAGFYPYTQKLQLGDTQFWGVAANELPNWVASKEWPLVTFVESVDGYPGGEGIYFYTAQSEVPWPWLQGASTDLPAYLNQPYLPPDGSNTTISNESLPPNFRAEYNGDYVGPPKLYVSPIDDQLHLQYAQGGLWNLGQGLVLRMHNLHGGSSIDGWTLERVPLQPDDQKPPKALPGTVIQALYDLSGFLIYSGPQGVTLRREVAPLASTELLPPTDKANWEVFRQRLKRLVNQPRDPLDLASWLIGIPGETLTLTGGQISAARATPTGFRFLLTLNPGFHPAGAAILPLNTLQAGRYVVTYDGTFQIEPSAPASLSAVVQPPVGPGVTVGEPVTLRVDATNRGLEDATNVRLIVVARHDGTSIDVARQNVDVLAGNTSRPAVTWQPMTSGAWEIDTQLQDSNGTTLAQGTRIVKVELAATSLEQAILAISTAGGWMLPTFVVLLLGAALVLVVARIALRTPRWD